MQKKKTSPEIAKMNEVIAEFMGYENLCSELYVPEWRTGMQMRFHKSWDWLMPVWGKLNRIINVDGEYTYSFMDQMVDIVNALSEVDIKTAHEAAYKVIVDISNINKTSTPNEIQTVR